jgi:hypothetical protein
MKNFPISAVLLCCVLCIGGACEAEPKPIPRPRVPEPPDPLPVSGMYDWEEARTRPLVSTDMVLLYGGGHHRMPYDWGADRVVDYVTYTDVGGTRHWLFDSFLFLEIFDGGRGAGYDKKFANGYTYQNNQLESANQEDWQALIDYYMSSSSAVGALESTIAQAAATMGEPAYKRQVVMSIPEPIVWHTVARLSTEYWGEVDGRKLDFSKPGDRVAACRWFIDTIRREFDERDFKYVELAGFYWLAEKATDTADILNTVADYLAAMNYSFNWIPYYTAAGWEKWESLGFSKAYLQPNYFFSDTIPKSRLDEACDMALSKGMDMELEFDDNAKWGRAYRLRDYMEVFRSRGIWEAGRLAYYQGGESLRNLKNGSAADRELYHEFCNFVVTRPIRSR